MSLFRFANISGPIKIDKKESEKKNLEAARDAELESILENHPSAFSIEEIVDTEIPNGNEEEKGNLKDELLNFISKKKEQEFKDFEDKYNPNKKNEEILTLENKIKEQRFDELKKTLTEEFIKNCEKEYYSFNKEERDHPFFVGIACRKLALMYIKELGVVIKEKEVRETKEKFKEYYYSKNKRPINRLPNPPENTRNFYEVEKPEDNPEE